MSNTSSSREVCVGLWAPQELLVFRQGGGAGRSPDPGSDLNSAGLCRQQPIRLRTELNPDTTTTCGKPVESSWSLSTADCQTTASSVHPLVPLLLYSSALFPPSPPFLQTTAAASRRDGQADAHSSCRHGNAVARAAVQVKKPLNAFMLYMKEMRHDVLQEGRERESAAINRILGRRWHALSRSEQSKYFDLAQKERLLHMQLHPGWSARDNYGKRKKKRRERTSAGRDF